MKTCVSISNDHLSRHTHRAYIFCSQCCLIKLEEQFIAVAYVFAFKQLVCVVSPETANIAEYQRMHAITIRTASVFNPKPMM